MNVEDRGHVRSSLRDQLEAAQFAQQMYHQSEIQKLESVIQTLVAEMREMKQEDEGSEIRIQELERQRDTACQDQLRPLFDTSRTMQSKRYRPCMKS